MPAHKIRQLVITLTRPRGKAQNFGFPDGLACRRALKLLPWTEEPALERGREGGEAEGVVVSGAVAFLDLLELEPSEKERPS